MNIESFRQESEVFLSKIEKEYYMHFSGQKDTLRLAGIYAAYAHLFDMGNIQFFMEKKKQSKNEQYKKTSGLLKFCTEGYMERQVQELYDKIAMAEANASIDIEGEQVPFRYSEVMLANEEDKQKRDRLDEKRRQKTRSLLSADLGQYWSRLHKMSEDLGFKDYKELCAALKNEDFSSLEKDMDLLLEQTYPVYRQHMSHMLGSQLGLCLEDARTSDFAYLKRAKRFDSLFQKQHLVSIFKDTSRAMGIDIDSQSNIIMDVEERKNKSPRAFCATVKVPDEIYLVVMPSGGQDDFEAMLHEGGHAQHFAHAGKDLDFEYKYLGDNALTEGFAFVFESLMQNRKWLKKYIGMDDPAANEFVYFSTIVKLWFCRRYAAKLKYELVFHSAKSLEGMEKHYSNILSQAVQMKYFEENYLKDIDECFYCTNYIRAWIFEAQLRDYLYTHYGTNWFENKKAGDFLMQIWAYGQKDNPREILKELGYDGLDIHYLISSLLEEIKKYRIS